MVAGDAQKILKTEIAEPVIFQTGDLAVVSGIHKVERVGKDGNPVMGQVARTYTFQRRQDKWLFVASQQTSVQVAQVAGTDEAAVRTVLEGHSQAVLNRDVEQAINYFANSPNTAILYQTPGGGYIRGFEDVANAYRKGMTGAKSDEKLTTDDYRYRIMGSSAFVTHVESYTKPDGAVSRTSNKANYMEKEGGQWKMVSNFWVETKKEK